MHLPQSNGGDFTPPPEGNHPARCYRVIDLGTQEVEWSGQTKLQRKILLSWELPTELMEDDKPFTVHQRYTFSSSDKSHFRNHLESWRGKRFEDKDFGPGGFKVESLLGVGCLLNVVHTHKNGSTYANVQAVARVPKGMEVPPLVNDKVLFSLEPDEYSVEVFDALPDRLKDTIRMSPEYSRIVNGTPNEDVGAPPKGDFDDSIPF